MRRLHIIAYEVRCVKWRAQCIWAFSLDSAPFKGNCDLLNKTKKGNFKWSVESPSLGFGKNTRHWCFILSASIMPSPNRKANKPVKVNACLGLYIMGSKAVMYVFAALSWQSAHIFPGMHYAISVPQNFLTYVSMKLLKAVRVCLDRESFVTLSCAWIFGKGSCTYRLFLSARQMCAVCLKLKVQNCTRKVKERTATPH